jgi:peptidoglycan/LPS O-acetylase OafA/YrhL
MEEKRALLPLTSLRFVAAAMIVVHHGITVNQLTPSPLALDQGVSFFFVLSGFILTYSYPRLESWAEVRRFWIFRIARVWPAHAVTAVAVIIIFSLPIDFKIIANLTMIQAWVPSSPWYFSYNPVSWSISTEFFFYLLFPLLIMGPALNIFWKLPLCAGLLAAMIVLGRKLDLPDLTTADTPSLHGLLYISPLARLLEFTAGMTACVVFKWTRPKFDDAPWWVFSFLEVGVLLFYGWALANHVFYGALSRPLPSGSEEYLIHADAWPAVVLVIFVFAFQKGAISRALSFKSIVLLGEASYSLYLVHSSALSVVHQFLGIVGYKGFVLGCATSLVFAFALWSLVEKPGRKVIRKLASLGASEGSERRSALRSRTTLT